MGCIRPTEHSGVPNPNSDRASPSRRCPEEVSYGFRLFPGPVAVCRMDAHGVGQSRAALYRSSTVWKRHRVEVWLAASAPEVPSNPSLQRARSARRRSSTPFPSVRSGVLTWNPPPSLCVQIDIRVVPCRSGKKGVMPVRTPIRQRPVSPARITGDFPDTRPSPWPESSARDACPLSVGSDPRVARDVFQTRIG
jgi:hypothetical protein